MVGKYNVINCQNLDAEYQSAKIIELNHIANELGEANRLKRWELKKEYTRVFRLESGKEIENYFKEELEDQA